MDRGGNMKFLNETIKTICQRASLRSFLDKEIPSNVLNQVLQAGVESASGGNLQPYSIIKITDKKKMKQIVDAGNLPFIADAPVNLLFCIDWHRTKRLCELEKAPFTADKAFTHFWISLQDTVIAAQSICTAADSVGLGTCYLGTVPQIPESIKVCKEIFKLPEGVFPVILVAMGYPEFKSNYRKKFRQNVLIHENEYKELSDAALTKACKEKYDGKRLKIVEDDKRVEKVLKTAFNSVGKKYTREIGQRMKESGELSSFQQIFGMHYCADQMPSSNKFQMESIKSFGFDIFEEFIKPEK